MNYHAWSAIKAVDYVLNGAALGFALLCAFFVVAVHYGEMDQTQVGALLMAHYMDSAQVGGGVGGIFAARWLVGRYTDRAEA